MINQNYKEKDLPIKEMEAVGLASNGKLDISSENLNALLSGKRTDLVRLTNISSEGVTIKALDAKISLNPTVGGKLNLLLHPIYKSAKAPDILNEAEIESLKNGTVSNLLKEIGEGGKKKTILVEFDNETNEFLKIDSGKIIAPESVNDQLLTQTQKKRFMEGQTIDLPDGTVLQATAKNNKGIVANNGMLVISLLFDGGVSYILMKGIQALGKNKQKLDYTKGYNDALTKVLKEQKQRNISSSNSNKNLIILKDFKEVFPVIKTNDSLQNGVQKINTESLIMQSKHLDVLKEVIQYDNLNELSNTVDPVANRKIANELIHYSQSEKNPIKAESDKAQAKQMEHFATLAEVVAMIEVKRDMVLNFIQENGKGINDVDYLKDVVSEISSSLTPEVKNEATLFVNESQEVTQVTLEEKDEEKIQVDNDSELNENVKNGFKR